MSRRRAGSGSNRQDQHSSASFIRRYRLVIGSAVIANVSKRTLKRIELEQNDLKRQLDPSRISA